MVKKIIHLSLLLMAGLCYLTTSFSVTHPFVFTLKTTQTTTGADAQIVGSKLFNEFQGSFGATSFVLYFTTNNNPAIHAADITIASPGSSSTCTLHVQIGGYEGFGNGPIAQVDRDPQCPAGILYDGYITDPGGHCNWGDPKNLMACYQLNVRIFQ